MRSILLLFRRAVYLARTRFFPAPYVVRETPRCFRRAVLRSYNQRRERGNVLRVLGKRRGVCHATS
jgi:hypothetical protein